MRPPVRAGLTITKDTVRKMYEKVKQIFHPTSTLYYAPSSIDQPTSHQQTQPYELQPNPIQSNPLPTLTTPT